MTDIAHDDDNPEWTGTDFARAKAEEHTLPAEVLVLIKRPPGRPKAERVKVPTSIRLDADVLAFFKSAGEGWQTRINETLRKAMAER